MVCQDSNKPIYLYINSAGGSVIAGLSIYDTMQRPAALELHVSYDPGTSSRP